MDFSNFISLIFGTATINSPGKVSQLFDVKES